MLPSFSQACRLSGRKTARRFSDRQTARETPFPRARREEKSPEPVLRVEASEWQSSFLHVVGLRCPLILAVEFEVELVFSRKEFHNQ